MIVVVAVLAVALVAALVAAGTVARSRSRAVRALEAARHDAALRSDALLEADQRRSQAVAAGVGAEGRAEAADRAATQARHQASEAEKRALTAERRAAVAERRATQAEVAASARPSGEAGRQAALGHLQALWELTALAAAHQRRQGEYLSTAAPTGGDPRDLAEVLAVEVGRLREESGTPGSLEVDLDPPAGAAVATVVVRAIQSLLETLARHCQGYDLAVGRRDDRIEVSLRCDGFDGPKEVTDETVAISTALRPAGGVVEVDTDDDRRLRVRLSLGAELPG